MRAALALVALLAGPALADPGRDDLDRRLLEQERRLVELQHRLEEQERELRAQREALADLEAAPPGGGGGGGAADHRGWPFGGYGLPDPERDHRLRLGLFFIEGNGHRLELRGRIHLDGRFLAQRDRDDTSDTFLVRRARLEMQGVLWRRLEFELSGEFGKERAELFEAYLNLRALPQLQLKVGQMRFPFGLTRTTSSNYLLHPERPVAMSRLVQGRDIGVMLHGLLLDGRLRWVLGAFNGVGANAADSDRDLDVAARLELRPVPPLLLGASFAYTPPERDGRGPRDVSTVGDEVTRFLDYDGDNVRRGRRVRAGADARVRWGPLEVAVEAIVDRSYDVRNEDGLPDDLWAAGGAVDVAWLITGEERRNQVEPKRPLFSEGEWGPGAFEVAARFETFRADPDVLRRGFARGTDRMDSGTFTLSWYPWKAIRLMLSYTYSRFDDPVTVAPGDRLRDEHVVITRLAAYW
ncbi:MAG: OprO/OprP family phosphate-selective porin [Planctomycetes bacterium]|nr:OprO/OprP family phosphate-selective porin [Planctomycetota bacterium]